MLQQLAYWDGMVTTHLMGQTTAPVPEPATLHLMGISLLGLAGYNRKRFSKKG